MDSKLKTTFFETRTIKRSKGHKTFTYFKRKIAFLLNMNQEISNMIKDEKWAYVYPPTFRYTNYILGMFTS